MSELISSKVVTTRKPHVCFACMRKFPSGTKMTARTCTEDGCIYTIRICEICEKITPMLDVSEYEDGFEEGYVQREISCYQDINTPAELLAYLGGVE